MEFYEESKEKYFVIGAVIDSATEGQETVVRYLMDNVMLEDEMFKIGNRPRTITEFRSFNNKNIKLFAKTNAEGKKMMKQRFGRIEDKFFQLIPKALAFKPIDDIKDFVYSYVLDEKEVNIDNLRENVRSYQELEKTLEGVKNRIEKLSEIECHHKAVVDCIQSDRMYEYFMAQSDLDMTKDRISALQDEIRRESYRLEQLNAKCSSMKKELENKEEVRTLLLAELNANSDFQTLEKQKKYLKELQEKEEIQYQEKKRLLESGKKAGQKVSRLLEIPDVDECMKQYDELLHRLKDTEDVVSAQELIDRAIAYKKHMSTKLQRKNLEIQSRLNEIAADLQETEQRISNLKQHRFSYPPAVELLMSRVEQELLKIGRTAKPRILCEMLEITDETWRNAVEGYLNTQRFYLLVEPENFDIALGIYEKLRREKKAYDYIISKGGTAFYPTLSTVKLVDGKRKTVEESRIPNLFFAYGTEEEIKSFVYDNVNLHYLRFYYRHFHIGNKIEPLIIPDNQIESLRIICKADADDIIVSTDEVQKFQKGQAVRIVEGKFKGVTGIVARYQGQQRVGIVIDGLLTMATAYIPNAFLEVVKK